MNDFVLHYYSDHVMVMAVTREAHAWTISNLEKDEDIYKISLDRILVLKNRMLIDNLSVEETRD